MARKSAPPSRVAPHPTVAPAPTAVSEKAFVLLNGNRTMPLSGDARIAVGQYICQLRDGIIPPTPASRPAPQIGVGCHELRVSDNDTNWRLVYYADTDAIVVLDIFSKTTNPIPDPIKVACKARLKRYLAAAKEPRPTP